MKKTIQITLLSFLGFGLSAQTLDDVELFNINGPHGTPRLISMGGAFTALGNDLSAVRLNPAGAAVFRQSRFSVSPGFNTLNGSQQGLFGQTNQYQDFSVNLDNIGFVWKKNDDTYGKNQSWAFAVTYDKLAVFDRDYSMSGKNGPGIDGENTLGQYYLFNEPYPDGSQGALNYSIESISDEAYAAYQLGILLDKNGDEIIDDYGYALQGTDNDLFYSRSQNGSHQQFGLTLAGETNDKIYYGVSVNFPSLNSFQQDEIRESNLPIDTFPFDVQSYSLSRSTLINANGLNLNFGVIFIPTKWMRLGASVQTPTWYSVTESYEFDMIASYGDGTSAQSDVFSTGTYSYKMNTPAIYRMGLGIILPKKLGVLSIDYEIKDLSGTNVKRANNSSTISQEFASDANSNIRSAMTSVNTIKGGLEIKRGPIMIRGGAAYSSSVYGNTNFRSDVITFSGGLGYQNQNFGVDLGLAHSKYSKSDVVHPFLEASGQNLINNDFKNLNVVAGFHFMF